MIDAYPLTWPPGWPRTKYPQPARFNTSFASARNSLMNELRLMGAKDVVISSNLETKRDGMPYATHRQPDDRGLAVYFKWNGEDQCVPCDKWNRTEDNLHAINKTIQALRGLERWGAKEMVNAAFRGFKALPEGGVVEVESPYQILGLDDDASRDEIKMAYRAMVLDNHPDRGGDPDEFKRIQVAYEAIK